ncbi:MAG: ester cyclase [Bosea sp. (in: a-proteobacteria)]|jgi:predicted ester cyclase|uniref:ester cyclase n=1 Tax=Bosea sp. (in: a-proteobacteria) TaxID=1871050 RepID=UPI003F7CC43D
MTPDNAKTVVRRFNEKVIVGGDREAFEALMSPGFVNRSAPPGSPNGPESMWNTFHNVLRPALAGLTVTIHDQVGEGDKVTTRKTISGKLVGELLGISPTGKEVSIDVIDIVRIEDGRYAEHWGINNLPAVLAHLRQA